MAILKNRLIKNFDSSDIHFLSYSFIIGIMFFYFIWDSRGPKEQTISFMVTLIGTIFTIAALLFTMFQQFKLKSATEKIAESKDQIDKAVRKGFYEFSFNKILWLCDKIEDVNVEENPELVKVFLKELKTILLDCKKAYLIHYNKQLETQLKSLKSKPELKYTDIEDALTCCKTECRSEWEENIKMYILRITSEYQVVGDYINKKITEINQDNLNNTIFEVSDFVNENKPDYVSNIDI